MNLIEQINREIKNALINKDINAKNVFKSVKATATNIAKESHSEITDDIVIKAIKKELKQLKQTQDSTPKDSSLNIAACVQSELIEIYLPKQLSIDELTDKIKSILSTIPSEANFGIKMKACMAELKDVADGKTIKQIIENT